MEITGNTVTGFEASWWDVTVTDGGVSAQATGSRIGTATRRAKKKIRRHRRAHSVTT